MRFIFLLLTGENKYVDKIFSIDFFERIQIMGNDVHYHAMFDAYTTTNDGQKFQMSHTCLFDHVLLFPQVIAHPEMTVKGLTLNYFIEDYCELSSR